MVTEGGRRDTAEGIALLRWIARMGAITAEALAIRDKTTTASARGRLQAAARTGLLERSALLTGQPALYVLSRAGARRSGLRTLEPCRVSASNATHLATCATVAARLERRYKDHRVLGERELRRDERELGRPLASALLGSRADGQRVLHRPDLVLWPASPEAGSPVAIEVELTVKAPRRLVEICLAWARCRAVAGVVYLAPPEVARALQRAIVRARAQERVVVVGLETLLGAPDSMPVEGLAESTVPEGL